MKRGDSATIAMYIETPLPHLSMPSTLTQTIHTTAHNPIHIRAFPTDFPSPTLDTSPTSSSAKATAAPALLLRGTKSMIPHRTSSPPTSSRSVLLFTKEALRSWAICSGVIGELSLATPAWSTVKDRMRAERRERIAAKDMMR